MYKTYLLRSKGLSLADWKDTWQFYEPWLHDNVANRTGQCTTKKRNPNHEVSVSVVQLKKTKKKKPLAFHSPSIVDKPYQDRNKCPLTSDLACTQLAGTPIAWFPLSRTKNRTSPVYRIGIFHDTFGLAIEWCKFPPALDRSMNFLHHLSVVLL